jgi:hypothetical protein
MLACENKYSIQGNDLKSQIQKTLIFISKVLINSLRIGFFGARLTTDFLFGEEMRLKKFSFQDSDVFFRLLLYTVEAEYLLPINRH